ncbi:hypothetical protein [Halorussus caseinilyticus]|uniref:Lipoprotein n=1 Tax=Halorussus caseinilyticus TaxID=3034025 RepID=A0ABD5WL29_9EURY|nr:hypothetical protein [Halorussus sp. DT72]
MSPSRRRVLRLGTVALAGSLAGCASGTLGESDVTETEATTESRGTPTTPESPASAETTTDDPTTYPASAGPSLPQGSVEFPAGPKSRPERPAVLTAASVREFVRTFERRWVYNRLYRDDSTTVHQECGVDAVEQYGEGFRVVAWCSAWANTGRNGTTLHADYFTQYATYVVGPDGTVRRDGKSAERE